jgi:riboflavin kinase/FMN adenylyltransferase
MPKSVVTLGTFDGVHRGHRALLGKVVSRARAIRAKAAALVFDMPPRHAGEPRAKPVLLTTLAEKRRILARLGIKRIQVLVFDKKTASTLPEDFFRHTIVRKHGAREMVVGPKVAFGKNRAGRLHLLRDLGKKYGVRIHVVPGIGKGAHHVSSRRIRALLANGHVEDANAFLGWPYSVEGKVVHGAHRGRRIGFPTANLEVDPGKILPPGVYWVKVQPPTVLSLNVKEARKGIDGLCNVGIRPTFTPHSHTMHCEVYVLRKTGRLYGHRLRVVFLRRLRPEKRFSSPAALQRQIKSDVALTRRWAQSG